MECLSSIPRVDQCTSVCQKFVTLQNFNALIRQHISWIQRHRRMELFGRPLAIDDSEMKLKIEQRKNQGIFILDVKGRLVLGDADLALRQALMAALESGERKVVLNLKEVSNLDSGALGTMVFFAQRFRESKGKLVLLQLNASEARLPEILRLDTLFESYKNEVDAVNSFFPDRVVSRYDILDFIARQELRQQLS